MRGKKPHFIHLFIIYSLLIHFLLIDFLIAKFIFWGLAQENNQTEDIIISTKGFTAGICSGCYTECVVENPISSGLAPKEGSKNEFVPD